MTYQRQLFLDPFHSETLTQWTVARYQLLQKIPSGIQNQSLIQQCLTVTWFAPLRVACLLVSTPQNEHSSPGRKWWSFSHRHKTFHPSQFFLRYRHTCKRVISLLLHALIDNDLAIKPNDSRTQQYLPKVMYQTCMYYWYSHAWSKIFLCSGSGIME